jgi:asparagine synthase (glutamine-hydrolysing)
MPDLGAEDGVGARFERSPGGFVERMMRSDAQTYLVDDILQKVDRATMAVSLEGRNPLLDPELADLAFRSTSAAEAEPGKKRLLRDTLRILLPDRLVDRPKMGFGVPVGEWMRRQLRPLVEDLVLRSDAPEYDAGVARQLTLDHLSGRRDATPQVWALFSFELWRDRWLSRPV